MTPKERFDRTIKIIQESNVKEPILFHYGNDDKFIEIIAIKVNNLTAKYQIVKLKRIDNISSNDKKVKLGSLIFVAHQLVALSVGDGCMTKGCYNYNSDSNHAILNVNLLNAGNLNFCNN